MRGYQTYSGADKSGRHTVFESNKSLDTILSSKGQPDHSLRSSAILNRESV